MRFTVTAQRQRLSLLGLRLRRPPIKRSCPLLRFVLFHRSSSSAGLNWTTTQRSGVTMERFVVVPLVVDGAQFTASTIDGDFYVVRDCEAMIVATFRNCAPDGRTPLGLAGIRVAAEQAVREQWREPRLYKLI